MKDYLIQNVCLGSDGKPKPLSPTDPSCASTRNLKAGERLYYHKHDQRGSNLDPAAANGYQRSDSYPREDRGSIMQIFDFGVGGATWGVKDSNDGFNIYETNGSSASIVATEDATGGVQYFLSPACTSTAQYYTDINDSWLIASTTFSAGGAGVALAKLMIEKNITTCPSSRYDESLTIWAAPSAPLTYTSGHTLRSLLSYHYSHKTVAAADHLEKFFFTDEFGPTRWERWERPNTPYHTNEKQRSETLAAAKTCNGPSVTSDVIGSWYRVDCREWTNIIPTSSTGDAPAANWAGKVYRSPSSTSTMSASVTNAVLNAELLDTQQKLLNVLREYITVLGGKQ